MARTTLIERGFDFGTDEVTGLPEVMVFDAVLSEAPSFEIAITENPVDTGVSMADHAYAKQDVLTLEVAVSDTPLLADSAGTPSYRLATTWTNGGKGSERRSVNAWEELNKKAKAFAVFDVLIGLGLYRNMMLETGSAKQDKDSSGILRAALKLKQVTFAVTGKVLYPPRGPKPVKRKAAPKIDDGHQEAKAIKPAEPEASWFMKILDMLAE